MKALRNLVPVLLLVASGCGRQPHDRGTRSCITNLMFLAGAKEMWAVEQHKSTNDVPTMADIALYTPGGVPSCPSGGTYTLGRVGQAPKCNIKGHELPPATTPTH